MTQAEKEGLPEEQWGGRKGRSSMDLGLDKLLTLDYARITRRPIGIVELDATACFDRIVRSVGMVSLIAQGLDPSVARWFLTWLKQAQRHQIINGHVSSLTYPSNSSDAQGVGQGITGAGTVWLTTDAMVTELYNRTAIPAILSCPQNQITLTKGSTDFIDDRTLYTSAPTSEEIRENIIKMYRRYKTHSRKQVERLTSPKAHGQS